MIVSKTKSQKAPAKKSTVLSLLALAALTCVLCLCACGGSATSSAPSSGDTISVSITIDASAADKGILFDAVVEVPADTSAYDVLDACDLPYSGNGSSVSSISGVSEGDYGSMSGWMYSVNEEVPMVYSNEYTLSDGDTVRWYYATEFEM